MSPNNPSNFVSDLVEMAKAFEELPRVREALDIANCAIEDYAKQVQRLEMRHIERTAELDALNSRIRSLEVERDEAQFHALEADDRTARALDFIKATFGNAGSLIQALEPPRGEADKPVDTASPVTVPVNQPEPEGVSVQVGEPAANSAAPTDAITPPPNASSGASVPETMSVGTTSSPDPSPAPEVAASPDPTASAADATTRSSATLQEAASIASADPSPPPSPNAYAGRTYSEVAKTGHYPTRDEWHAGGGTVDNWYA